MQFNNGISEISSKTFFNGEKCGRTDRPATAAQHGNSTQHFRTTSTCLSAEVGEWLVKTHNILGLHAYKY